MPRSSVDAFAALARSSPWRWTTLRFTVRWTLPHSTWPEAVRGRLRRPDSLRVETLSGELIQVVRDEARQVGVLTTGGGRTVALPWVADGPAPQFRADGLVAARPSSRDVSYDAPMFQDYRWVAMLDPVELADGRDHHTGAPSWPALAVEAVTEVEHAGRPCWEAVVRTTAVYEPRCGCCPLLRTRDVDRLEFADSPELLLTAYPDAFRVRLDLGTGVCVLTEELGGLTPGAGHDLRIEAVDEPMSDGLFVEPRRARLPRPGGWSPVASPGLAGQ